MRRESDTCFRFPHAQINGLCFDHAARNHLGRKTKGVLGCSLTIAMTFESTMALLAAPKGADQQASVLTFLRKKALLAIQQNKIGFPFHR